MKGFKFFVSVSALVMASVTASAAVLDFNNRAVVLNERMNSCGGVASLRFKSYEAVLELNTVTCSAVQLNGRRAMPNKVYYTFPLNTLHHITLMSTGGHYYDNLKVNTFVLR